MSYVVTFHFEDGRREHFGGTEEAYEALTYITEPRGFLSFSAPHGGMTTVNLDGLLWASIYTEEDN